MNPISKFRVAPVLAVAGVLAVAAPALAIGPGVPTTGPDVTIFSLSVGGCGTSCGSGAPTSDGSYVGYAVGTTSCNIGTVPVNWCDSGAGCGGGTMTSAQHPVIAQGIYRLYQGRFEQVGASMLKHGFLSTNSPSSTCKVGSSCQSPPFGGDQLGVGCLDTYGPSLNGGRSLGLRSEVNATNGVFPFPETNTSFSGASDQRVKILKVDLDTVTDGALFWAEGHYIADNDATNGNGLNNASYQSVSVNSTTYAIATTGSIVRERTAIHAWKAADPAVEEVNVDLTGGGVVERFEVARKVTDNGNGTWRYVYAIRNMNSDRSANSFTVDFGAATTFSGIGFHDIDHHPQEGYATTDWSPSTTANTIVWQTDSFGVDPDANALRWANLFTFWFDADRPPGGEAQTLGLFKPGSPSTLSWVTPLFNDGFEAHNLAVWSAVTF